MTLVFCESISAVSRPEKLIKRFYEVKQFSFEVIKEVFENGDV